MGRYFTNFNMKFFILSAFCMALLAFNPLQSQKKIKKYTVSGVITGTSGYCGGAAPSDEMLADLATPKPIANKKIYIKKGVINSLNSKVLMTLTADSAGKFHTTLPPGKYIIVDENKKDRTYYNSLLKNHNKQTENFDAVDSVCLKEWFAKPDFIFEVKNAGILIPGINYHKECFNLPCVQFRGPYPP